MTSTDTFRLLVVIPVFNHAHAITALVQTLQAQSQSCLLVDDGSEPGCAAVLADLAAQVPSQVALLRLPSNQGKGAAVMAGLREAGRRGYSHALQIDADGQHDCHDVPGFVAAARENPQAVIVGAPIFDSSVPKGRLYGRYATHIWVWINTLSFDIRDSMCGFRVYPLDACLPLLDQTALGQRMDFDSEVLVRLHWQGEAIINRPTRVIYPQDGVSHFDVWRDNVRISRMHARLFFGMLVRLPRLLLRRLSTR